MDQILHNYSALNAEMQEEVKILVLVVLQNENDETIKDYEILNNVLIEIKDKSTLENGWRISLELLN